MAVLDKANRGRHWFHRRPRLYVRSVQNVRTALPAVARVQPRHIRSELPGGGARTTGRKREFSGQCEEVGSPVRMSGNALFVLVAVTLAYISLSCILKQFEKRSLIVVDNTSEYLFMFS